MFNSVSRRYTPPTCTLEISAQNSPLSRWTERSVVRQVQFQLSFDDPTLPPDRQVRLQGDRSQLEALNEAVTAYVQAFLAQSTLPLTSVNGNGATAMAERAALTVLQPVEAAPAAAIDAGIQLKPNSLVSHELHLGTLATPESGEVLNLSTVQLSDLVDALDAYSSDVLALPSLGRSRWPSSRRSWLAIAAGTVLAVGLGTTLLRFVSDVSAPVQMAATSDDSETIAAVPAPVPTAPGAPSTVTVAPGSEFASPRPLTLPPPPPPGTTLPPAASTQRPAPPAVAVPPGRVQSPPRLPSIAVAPPPSRPQAQVPTAPITIVPSPARPSAPEASSDTARTAAVSPPAAESSSPNAGAVAGTAFDTIPQVAEARDFFQQRWQPPEGLTQTLEYRLQVGADGTITRITPLGQAAGDFVDRTQIPLVGEPFVSPLTTGESAQMRVVLSPDGRVRTFLESQN